MIWRITDRSSFGDLRREGARIRQGPITVTYLAESGECPSRLAFAVGRRVGSAVVRNRLRRRVRAIVRERLAQGRQVPAGAYLVGMAPPAAFLSYQELRDLVEQALDRVGKDRRA